MPIVTSFISGRIIAYADAVVAVASDGILHVPGDVPVASTGGSGQPGIRVDGAGGDDIGPGGDDDRMIVFNDTASDIFDGGDGRATLSITNGAAPTASPARAGSRSGRRSAIPLSTFRRGPRRMS